MKMWEGDDEVLKPWKTAKLLRTLAHLDRRHGSLDLPQSLGRGLIVACILF